MQSKPQLFCFTYAGGNRSFFDEIEGDLIGVDVIKLEYAGHGDRHKEDYYHDFSALAEDMLHEVKCRLCGDYALFGYSMGSITLVEVLRRIIGQGLQQPKQVFLAAHEPHTKSELLGFNANELDEWVKERTIEFGAIPEKLRNNKVFWRTYLPLYRADYTIIGKYEFEKLDMRTNIPATIFYSETDTPKCEMNLWKNYFIGDCHFYRYEGNHFFIQKNHIEMAKVIMDRLGIKAGENA